MKTGVKASLCRVSKFIRFIAIAKSSFESHWLPAAIRPDNEHYRTQTISQLKSRSLVWYDRKRISHLRLRRPGDAVCLHPFLREIPVKNAIRDPRTDRILNNRLVRVIKYSRRVFVIPHLLICAVAKLSNPKYPGPCRPRNTSNLTPCSFVVFVFIHIWCFFDLVSRLASASRRFRGPYTG